MRRFALAPLLLAVPLCFLLAADPPPYSPKVSGPSREGESALTRIRVPAGLKASLFAAEPMLANPVSFCIDERGRFYVAETFRLHAGVPDIRGHMDWLDDDLACRTVEDRVAMYRRKLGAKAKEWAVEHERVRLIEDRDGDGVADHSTVFADGFNHLEDGIAAGLLARGNDVWYACLPDLWLLRDSKGTGKADQRTKLSSGYGLHVGYIGHDLHGLTLGPDGKLYFSMADRGLNVKTKEGERLFSPDTGCVLRCNLDGSELEVYATGLRNPQELAFDQYGNLFTGDNNSDGGDQARWVWLVEGGDSGWRNGFQYETSMGNRGPWNAERMWQPSHPGQPAWIVPPIANVADGPSGLAYYPGLGLPARYEGHFFLADFRGAPVNSGIRSFAVKPKGAGFEIVDAHEFVWSVLATDCDFGPDCAFYLSDWVSGWGLPGKGRIYKVADPAVAKSAEVAEVRKLLAEGFTKRTTSDLLKLLSHKHLKVRQEAQFALAARGQGEGVLEGLAQVAHKGKEQLARLHAIWALGQIGRKAPGASTQVRDLTADPDPEVRTQAAKVLGEGKVASALGQLLPLLADREPRVRFHAALALARLGKEEAVAPALKLLQEAGDDPYLRYGGVRILASCATAKDLSSAAESSSLAVRRAVLLAYRRKGSAEVARFLKDADPALVLEAARAINDVPIEKALPQLAALIRQPKLSDLLGYRVLNAALLVGTAEQAEEVARFAGRSDGSEALRVEAVQMLLEWEKPAGRDRVMGVWRQRGTRLAGVAARALRDNLKPIFLGPDRVRHEAVKVVARLGIKEAAPDLRELLADGRRSAAVRVEALDALVALKDPGLDRAVQTAVDSSEPQLRNEGRRVLALTNPAAALASLEKALDAGEVAEQQGAFAILAGLKGEAAGALLGRWLDALREGKVRPEVQLDLLEAAQKQGSPALKEKLARYEEGRAKGDHLAKWREAIVGGNAENGRKLFLHKAETYCLRCHKVKGQGGEVGPDLTGIGARQKRDYILESIVDPNRQIATGYELVLLTLVSGKQVSGVVKGEDAREVRLMTPEAKLLVVKKNEIEDRQVGKSAMPEDIVKHLSRREVRDLVEFLAGLKEEPKKDKP